MTITADQGRDLAEWAEAEEFYGRPVLLGELSWAIPTMRDSKRKRAEQDGLPKACDKCGGRAMHWSLSSDSWRAIALCHEHMPQRARRCDCHQEVIP